MKNLAKRKKKKKKKKKKILGEKRTNESSDFAWVGESLCSKLGSCATNSIIFHFFKEFFLKKNYPL
jgi:hypothetical protein